MSPSPRLGAFAMIKYSTLLGAEAPFSWRDVIYVFGTRTVPIALVCLAVAPVDQSVGTASLTELEMLAVALLLAAPLVETVAIVLVSLMIPIRSPWLASSAMAHFLVCIAFGLAFASLHTRPPIEFAMTWLGGAVMFAIMLQHRLVDQTGRGGLAIYLIHIGFNFLMLSGTLLKALLWA
jgi:hypothetical protein